MYTYSRYLTPIKTVLPVRLYSSSSAHNSILIRPIHTLIDLGLPYRRYDQNDLIHLNYIALTHEHGDHLNPSTLLTILNVYQQTKVILSDRLYETLRQVHPDLIAKLPPKQTIIVPLNHNVQLTTTDNIGFDAKLYGTHHSDDIVNTAYDITIPYFRTRLLYASDLDTTLATPDPRIFGLPQTIDAKYNLMFLEANYNEVEIKPLLAKADYQQHAHLLGNLRHLSEQKAAEYVYHHLTDKGVYVPLHASTAFGTYLQHPE